MNSNNRNKLDYRIKDFFVDELKKEFKEDFALIESKLYQLIPNHNMKDIKYILRQEVVKIKHAPEMHKR